MYSNNLEGRQGSDLIQYSVPWEYELTNKQQVIVIRSKKLTPWYSLLCSSCELYERETELRCIYFELLLY